MHRFNLQYVMYYNFKLTEKKTKVVTFKGMWPVCSKNVVNGQSARQYHPLINFPGCDVSFEFEHDITSKVHKCLLMCTAANETKRRKALRDTYLKFCKLLVTPLQTQWSMTQALRKKEIDQMR